MQLRRTPRLTFVLWLLALSACGGAAKEPEDEDMAVSSDAAAPLDAREADASEAATSFEAVSGSRIHGVYLQSADGTSVLEKLHDTQLDIDCTWTTAADGVLRCLPTSVVSSTLDSSLTYSDSECTIPVYEIAATDCVPATGSYLTTLLDTCPTGTRVFAVGAQIVPPAQTYGMLGPDGACVAEAPVTTQQFFSLSEVGQAFFVRGDDIAEPAGALTSLIVAGSDGSRSFRTLRDEPNGIECAFMRATDGMLRCLPDRVPQVYAGSFSDSSCLVPDVVTSAHDCPLDFAHGDAVGCPLATPIYAVGATVAQEFDGLPGSCSALDLIDADVHSTAGIVPPATFVAGVPDVLAQPASARLQPRIVRAGATSVSVSVSATGATAPSFHDTMRSEDCIPVVAADDVTRCLPLPIDPSEMAVVALSGQSFFADTGCTVPVAVAVAVPCAVPAYGFGIQGTQACDTATASVRVYPIIGTHAGTVSVKTSSTPCMALPLPSGAVVYDVGPEVSASAFVELTRATH